MTLYVINHCNEWHEYSSFRLICIVDEEHLPQTQLLLRTKLSYSIEDMEKYIDVNKIVLNDLGI